MENNFINMNINKNKRSLIMLPVYNAELNKEFNKRDKCYEIQTCQIVLDPYGDFARATHELGLEVEDNKRKIYLEFIKNSEFYFNEIIEEISNSIKNLSKDKKELSKTVAEMDKSSLNNIKKLKKFLFNLPYLKSEEKLNELTTEALFKLSSYISYSISERFYSLRDSEVDRIINKLKNLKIDEKDSVVKLVDFSKDGRYNPFWGDEFVVINEFVKNFSESVKEDDNYSISSNNLILSNAIKILKRTYGNNATIKHLISLVNNKDIDGITAEKILTDFELLAKTNDKNKELITFFRDYLYKNFISNCYYNEQKDSLILRNYLDTTFNNVELFDLLCPTSKTKTINIQDIINFGDKVSFAFNSKQLKSNSLIAKLILQRIEGSIYLRHGAENSRSYGSLYLLNENLYNNIKEFEGYKKKASYRIDTFSIFQPE